jgi:NADH-quinone oxidoreductase subunit N
VISAFVYLRIIVAMYMRPAPDHDTPVPAASGPARLALAVCVFATVTLGILPGVLSEVTRDAVPALVAVGER